jgi:hypothetical protein
MPELGLSEPDHPSRSNIAEQLIAGGAGARPVHPILRHSKVADGPPLSVEERSCSRGTRMTESDVVDGARSPASRVP